MKKIPGTLVPTAVLHNFIFSFYFCCFVLFYFLKRSKNMLNFNFKFILPISSDIFLSGLIRTYSMTLSFSNHCLQKKKRIKYVITEV